MTTNSFGIERWHSIRSMASFLKLRQAKQNGQRCFQPSNDGRKNVDRKINL
jgi:hypothetical protein